MYAWVDLQGFETAMAPLSRKKMWFMDTVLWLCRPWKSIQRLVSVCPKRRRLYNPAHVRSTYNARSLHQWRADHRMFKVQPSSDSALIKIEELRWKLKYETRTTASVLEQDPLKHLKVSKAERLFITEAVRHWLERLDMPRTYSVGVILKVESVKLQKRQTMKNGEKQWKMRQRTMTWGGGGGELCRF